MDVAETDRIVNAVPNGWRMIAVAVPTRALRVIADDFSFTFRVEQLDARTWTWFTCASHKGDEQWEALGPSIQDMMNKQGRLKEKLKLAQHNNNMARIKAENPYAN